MKAMEKVEPSVHLKHLKENVERANQHVTSVLDPSELNVRSG